MFLRSTVSHIPFMLFSPEDGGGAAPVDTGGSAQVDSGPADTGDSGGVDSHDSGSNEPPLEQQLSDIWDKAHSPVERDPLTGRFQSKNPQAQAQTATSDEDDLDDDPDLDDDGLDGSEGTTDPDDGIADDLTAGDEEGDGSQGAITAKPPQSWSKADKAAWAALPENVKQIIHKREGDIAQVIGRAGQVINTLNEAKPLLAGIEPYKDYLKQREQITGVPAGRLVNDVLRFAHSFDTAQSNDAKLGILEEIVGAFGIDLSPWIGADAAEVLRTRGDSSQEVQTLRHQVAQLTQTLNERAAQDEEVMSRSIMTAITKAQNDTKQFPYFRHVKARMGQLIGALDPNDDRPLDVLIKEAYETACWAHPKIRERLQKQQAERQSQEHQKRVQDRGAKARRAAATNVNGGVPSPSKRSMEDTVRHAAERFFR